MEHLRKAPLVFSLVSADKSGIVEWWRTPCWTRPTGATTRSCYQRQQREVKKAVGTWFIWLSNGGRQDGGESPLCSFSLLHFLCTWSRLSHRSHFEVLGSVLKFCFCGVTLVKGGFFFSFFVVLPGACWSQTKACKALWHRLDCMYKWICTVSHLSLLKYPSGENKLLDVLTLFYVLLMNIKVMAEDFCFRSSIQQMTVPKKWALTCWVFCIEALRNQSSGRNDHFDYQATSYMCGWIAPTLKLATVQRTVD